MACDLVKEGKTIVKASEWPEFGLKITSDNNFPTAAGLASSASGLACFTKCLAAVYQIPDTEITKLTAIARQGSGSASRSLHGGYRAKHVVPKRMEAMKAAIRTKDFDAFAKLTMADSNQFHAICLDTEPPLFYMNVIYGLYDPFSEPFVFSSISAASAFCSKHVMTSNADDFFITNADNIFITWVGRGETDTSRDIIDYINAFNATKKDEEKGGLRAAYTYDAGPNACIYLLKDEMEECLAGMVKEFCPKGWDPENFVYDPMGISSYGQRKKQQKKQGFSYDTLPDSGVKMIIVTKIGAGATILKD
eukprot:jgi/Bigna1/68404/fgenesh1_pg.6_\